MQADGDFDRAWRQRERILMFVPVAEELERLERGGAFAALAGMFDVTCVIPTELVGTRVGAAAGLCAIERIELRLGDEQKGKWLELFPPVRHPLLQRAHLRWLSHRMVRAILEAVTPIAKVLNHALLRLVQVPFLPLRARRLLLAAATLEHSEDFPFCSPAVIPLTIACKQRLHPPTRSLKFSTGRARCSCCWRPHFAILGIGRGVVMRGARHTVSGIGDGMARGGSCPGYARRRLVQKEWPGRNTLRLAAARGVGRLAAAPT